MKANVFFGPTLPWSTPRLIAAEVTFFHGSLWYFFLRRKSATLSNHSETIVSDGYLLDSSFLQKANTISLSGHSFK